jgi:hypothetical protein
MRDFTRIASFFSVAVVVSSSLTAAFEAHANNYRRVGASTCIVAPNSNGSVSVSDNAIKNYGSNGTSVELYCAVIDESGYPKASAQHLYLDMVNENSAPSSYWMDATACVTAVGLTGAWCGTHAQGKAAGWNSLDMDISQWSNSNYSYWYPWYAVSLGAQSYHVGALETF